MLGKDYKVIEKEGFASIYQAQKKEEGCLWLPLQPQLTTVLVSYTIDAWPKNVN